VISADNSLVYMSPMKNVDKLKRPPVYVSLGCNVEGAAMPHCDPSDPKTTAAGALRRIAVKTPPIDPELLPQLEEFVDKWCEENLTRLAWDTPLDIETWLANTSYPAWRKQELRDAWKEHEAAILGGDTTFFGVAGHMKDEGYAENKHARGIHARHDVFKCAVGPIFQAIEREVYKNPAFIKHVPVADRPTYIKKMLYRLGAKYFATDYTSFEALFAEELMKACELRMYRYMTRDIAGFAQFQEWCEKVLAGTNDIQYHGFWMQVQARRMSGEMCTSLGNGFSNLMFMLFMCKLKGCTDVQGVVEGDDGLFVGTGDFPAASDFARLGLVIKMETHFALETASFCGLVFDTEDMVNLTDPREVLASFGWAGYRYVRSKPSVLEALLRSKALSLVHQYPGCPIIQALGQYGMRMTRKVKNVRVARAVSGRGFAGWDRDQYMAALVAHEDGKLPSRPVPIATRLLAESLYGISVEHQIAIEQYLDSLTSITPLTHPLILHHMPLVWQDYWDRYVQSAVGDPNYPVLSLTQVEGFTDVVEEVLAGMRLSWSRPPARPSHRNRG